MTGFDRGDPDDKPGRMKRKRHHCTQAACTCWKCLPNPTGKVRCKVCHEVFPFEPAFYYRRTTSLPFGVKSACCNWHNHQPVCKWCQRKYLNARSASDKVRALMAEACVSIERLVTDTYHKSITLDVSRLSAETEHRLTTVLLETFKGVKEQPELHIKCGRNTRRVR